MSKVDKKKINNLISHNNGTINIPSFTKDILKNLTKELYVSLAQTIQNLNNIESDVFTKESLNNLVIDLIDKNELLNEEYTNKYIQAIYENNEIYNLFEGTLKANEEKYQKDLLQLDLNLKKEFDQISEKLQKFQQDSIYRYKTEENIFLPKAKFLTTNKKINKDEYIKVITEINHVRISANQNYIAIANDLSSINEQQQMKFKHSIESAEEKNKYDKQVFTEEADEKILVLNKTLEESENENRQLIQIKERKIIQNTIEVNELITKLGEEYSNRLKYAYIPYEIKSNKLIDEQSENNRLYNIIEENVLEEFKTLLQENDNEIEELRQKHRTFEEKYLKELKEIKKSFNSTLQKEINAINKNIAIATKKYTYSLKKEDKLVVKRLVAQKKKHIKTSNKLKKEKIKSIKKEYYQKELIFIKRFEQLRTKKSQCEAIKSSAMKNINYERVFHHERINSEIKLIAFEKDSFSTTDHYEEIKDIYNNRLKCSLENELLHYDINEKELEIYIKKVNIKYQKDKILAEKEYNIMLSDADLVYQQETTKNRINYYNVKTMLDIQKQSIINDFEVLITNEKMNFEQIKNIFYNNCDNIQYELYKVSNELTYKLIDTEVKFQQDLAEVERQHVKAINNYKKNTLSNKKTHEENILQIKLYENRLEIEKMMISDAYSLFLNSMRNVIDFENFLHSNIHTLSKESFALNKKEILTAFQYLKKIKLRLIDEYYNNETTIIKTRLNFETGIKFKKQFDNAEKEYLKFINYSKNRTEKTIHTKNSYQETLTLFLTASKKTKKEISKLRLSLIKKAFNKKELENIKKEIQNNKENITLLKKQIKANKNNIKKMKILSSKQEKERTLREKKYNVRFKKIEKQQSIEAKVYNDELFLIEQQYNKLKNKIERCSNYLSVNKYIYETAPISSSYVVSMNNLVVAISQHYFDIHFSKLNESLTTQYSLQKELYYKNFERYSKEIKKSYSIENREYETNKLAISSAHKSNVETLEKHALYSKNKLLIELKKLNTQHLINFENFNHTIEKIKSKKEYELACHEENYQMYLKRYNDTNSEIINRYLAKIKEIKETHNLTLINIENKYNQTKKSFKTQHANNLLLRKNNILNYENENKENIKNTTIKIKKVNQNEKESRQKHEVSKKISFKLYLQNQRNTRKEFSVQLKQIEKRCNKRITTLQKEFKKQFKKEQKL